ncbi:MAG: LCP family protein [Chloroflexi bacterium]|nr:LCP family protein [Chloroflexota bacterium]
MQGSEDGRHWRAPLSVAVATLALPLGLLGWQVFQLLPPPDPPPPAPTIVAERLDPLPTVQPIPQPTPIATLQPTAVPPPPPTLIPTPIPTPRPAWSGASSFNFVAVGVDRREDGEIPRTDTLIIGNLDLVAHRLRLISIPRDLVVEIPGYGKDRINSAYVYGEQYKERDGGIGLLRRTLEWNFAIPIQHFGMLDFRCFRTAVDAVGGVFVNVPRPLVDTRYPTEDYGYRTVRFEPGPQLMDGGRALEYARTRNPDNDLGRIRRQQQVVVALRQQLLQLRALPALPAIVGGCRNFQSDLQPLDYVNLANAVRQLGESDITLSLIDEQMAFDGVAPSGALVLVPRWDRIRSLVRDTFPPTAVSAAPPPPPPATP